MNERYSYGDFHRRQFTDEPAADFAGEIVGSCFQQDQPNTAVFPRDVRARFIRCNLNNCTIPPGCQVGEGCVNHQHREQRDKEQWVIDRDGKPVEPLHRKAFERFGLSVDPRDIPAEPVATSPVQKADEKTRAEKEIARMETEIARLKAEHGISVNPAPVPLPDVVR